MFLLSIMFVIIFFIHNVLYFKTTAHIIELRSIKNVNYLLQLISFLASVVSLSFFFNDLFFILFIPGMFCFFLIELMIFYKGSIYNKMAIVLLELIHSLTIESLIIAIISMVLQINIEEVLFSIELRLLFRIIVLVIFNIIFLCILTKIPKAHFRRLGQSIKSVKIFLCLEIIIILALNITAITYHSEAFNNLVFYQRIMQCITSIGIIYLGLFALVYLEIYETNNSDLQNSLKLTKFFQNTFIDQAELFLQIDCTNDKVLNINSAKTDLAKYVNTAYSSLLIKFLAYNHVYSENITDLLKMATTEYMIQTFDNKQQKYTYECQISLRKNSNFRWFKIDILIAQDYHTQNILALIVVSDTTEQKQLKMAAEKDPLTGLHNKPTAEKLIMDHIEKYTMGVLLIVDGDSFKNVNSILGYDIGNNVIMNMSKTLLKIFNITLADINNIDTNVILGRIGGDEFMVFIKDQYSYFNIVDTATSICKELEKTYFDGFNSNSVKVSASIGIAEVTKEKSTFKDVYSAAYSALYTSKKNGKNQFTIHNSTLDNK
ncbi:MAG: hypothetical protein ATN32_06725 [Candidatus Epulonipiscium fishelsonii]|nr:MAG: hypothetical protein ATN32_06725 [Epulopiscium sp. AS2M-Bin002]